MRMVNDAHIHFGWWRHKTSNRLRYFSPLHITTITKRAGIDMFCASSTSVFKESFGFILDEYRELNGISQGRCRSFLWLTLPEFLKNPHLKLPDDLIFSGIKIHNGESAWLANPCHLNRLLSIASERGYRVVVHTGMDDEQAKFYLCYCQRFPNVYFNLAHMRPIDQIIPMMAMCQNIYADISFVDIETLARCHDRLNSKRILFGTDYPVVLDYERCTFKHYVEARVNHVKLYFIDETSLVLRDNFKRFLGESN